jgi:IS5 family transposase
VSHHGFDLDGASARRVEGFERTSVVALRSNIARHLAGLGHRGFCTRLADSQLLQWFLRVGQPGGIKTFAKSTSDRFGRWLDEAVQHEFDARLTALLTPARGATGGQACDIGLEVPISFDDIYFDSTCLKAGIHFPIDRVLLRDATRTLMKPTLIVRRAGLRKRMPQEPLDFVRDMNTLCMKMTAKRRSREGQKHRKAVLLEMKKLVRRVGDHAQRHLEILLARHPETALKPGQVKQISAQLEGVLVQLPDAINQAHERIIGGRKLPNGKKILSLYDPDVQVLVRGKSGDEVEFGNKLWLGETREGYIVDYQLEAEQISDAKHVLPAMVRLVDEQGLQVESVWGDRGTASEKNKIELDARGIRSGLCPRAVGELAARLEKEPGMREGLKRRASTEARISILSRVFIGDPTRAKGIDNRGRQVGWAVLSHNLWVLARLQQEEVDQTKQSNPKARAA